MSRLAQDLEQIRVARSYTVELLENIDPVDWFRQPAEGVTHVAWQVGHLAVAQFRLALERLRGPRPEDAELLPKDYLTLFGKGSTPDPDPGKYPATGDIRRVFDRVHEQVLSEAGELTEAALDEPTDQPHPRFNTKHGALVWCAMHEMLHAGQLGLLRRLLGEAPLR